MTSPVVISRTDVAQLLDWPTVLKATRTGLLVAGSPPTGSAVSAQVLYESGSLHLKAATLNKEKIISVKSNLRPNRGGVSGVLLAYDLETEQLSGIIDAGLMTAWRTGAIAAVAAERLVEPRPTKVAILGVGPVGQQCASGILRMLNVVEMRFWSHHADRSKAVAQEFSDRVTVRACEDASDAVSGVDLIVTATPASEPILTDQVLQPGVVILAMGADTAGKRELALHITSQSLVIADVPTDALRVGESAYLSRERGKLVTPLSLWLTSAVQPDRDDSPLVFDSVGSSHVDAAVTAVIMARASADGRGHQLQW